MLTLLVKWIRFFPPYHLPSRTLSTGIPTLSTERGPVVSMEVTIHISISNTTTTTLWHRSCSRATRIAVRPIQERVPPCFGILTLTARNVCLVMVIR